MGARETLEVNHTFTLVGLDLLPHERACDVLTCALEVANSGAGSGSNPYENLIHKCFKCDIVDGGGSSGSKSDPHNINKISSRQHDSEGNSGGDKITVGVHFAPLRPFASLSHLVFKKTVGGGRWRFNLSLESLEPEVDDIIEIESPLNKPASVCFRLCNNSAAYAEFDAFFDAESSNEFSISPQAGVLEPAPAGAENIAISGGQKGTPFIVTFLPTEYGKQVSGKLIIQTDEVMWSFLVRGYHPKYQAPVCDTAKVDTRISNELARKLNHSKTGSTQKNFIRSNISATKSSIQH